MRASTGRLLATAMLLSPALARAAEAPVCLSAIRIHYTDVVDDGTILFHMRDHSLYRNVLEQRCIGLRNDPKGFSYSPSDESDALCSHHVTIRTNTFGAICELGAFVRVK